MIDLTSGLKQQAAQPPALLPVGTGSIRKRVGADGTPEGKAAERRKKATSSDPVLDRWPGGETRRLRAEFSSLETSPVPFCRPVICQGREEHVAFGALYET